MPKSRMRGCGPGKPVKGKPRPRHARGFWREPLTGWSDVMLKFAQLAPSVKSRYRAADAVTVVAASEQQERTLPGGQGRRSTYDGSIDAPAEAGDEIEGGWRREELLAMDIRRAPQARDL